jgi:hypothetical protein
MIKSGKSLEQLVTRLEKVLAPSDNIKVECRKRVKDKKTGRLREHDVVVTIQEAHHSVMLALECRDRSRPIGVNEVEAFSRKCEDTGIDQGIMVSALGFYNSAKIKAEAYGLRCLTMKEAFSFDWFYATNLKTEQVKIIQFDINFILQSEQTPETITEYAFVDSNGSEVPRELLRNNALKQLKSLREQTNYTDNGLAKFIFDGQDYRIRDKKTGAIYPLQQIEIDVKYEVKTEFSPFRLYQYSDESIGKVIGDAAVSKLELGDFSGDVTFVKDPEQGIKLAFFPQSGIRITDIKPDKESGT